MDNNLLAKLEKKSNFKLKVKPVFYNNNDKFVLNSFLRDQKYLNSNEIFEILKINFLSNQPVGYALFKNEKNIVGFLGTIFSNRPIGEKKNQSLLFT